MLDNELYITITGLDYFQGISPFRVGSPLILVKEKDNEHDTEAIAVISPLHGQVGYVANSPKTTVKGTMSAGRIYDFLPDECTAVIRFITTTKVIAMAWPDKKLTYKIDYTLEPITKDPPAVSAEPVSDRDGDGVSTEKKIPKTEE